MRILHVADVETAGGGQPAKTIESGKAALEQQIEKLFPEDAESRPEPGAETAKQPEPKGEGETTDLLQTAKGEEHAEAEEAKASGMTVPEYREAQKAEQERTTAIIARTGETLEEIYAREEKDGKPTDLETAKPKDGPKTFSQDEVEATVQKRVKKLARENEELRQQLAVRPETAEAAGTLDEREASLQSGVDRVDDLFDQMRSDPQAVEAELRKMLGTAAPAEMTPEYMRGVLRKTKRGLESQIEQVKSGRQNFATERQKVEKLLTEPEVTKAAPFISAEESEDHAAWQQLRKHPILKGHPRGDYLATALLIGLKQLQPAIKQLADRQAGKPAAAGGGARVKLKVRSKMPGTGAAAVAGKGGRLTLEQARAKGNPEAMADAMGL